MGGGAGYRQFFGAVHMREAPIYIKNYLKKTLEGCRHIKGGRGRGVKISLSSCEQ